MIRGLQQIADYQGQMLDDNVLSLFKFMLNYRFMLNYVYQLH